MVRTKWFCVLFIALMLLGSEIRAQITIEEIVNSTKSTIQFVNNDSIQVDMHVLSQVKFKVGNMDFDISPPKEIINLYNALNHASDAFGSLQKLRNSSQLNMTGAITPNNGFAIVDYMQNMQFRADMRKDMRQLKQRLAAIEHRLKDLQITSRLILDYLKKIDADIQQIPIKNLLLELEGVQRSYHLTEFVSKDSSGFPELYQGSVHKFV